MGSGRSILVLVLVDQMTMMGEVFVLLPCMNIPFIIIISYFYDALSQVVFIMVMVQVYDQ